MKNIRPQTIQIFLPDGSPTSIKEAEITNRLVKAVLFPRNRLKEVNNRELIHFAGVYFLFGITEEGKPLVYIGEGEDCYLRIQEHNRTKDFWTHGVAVVTKTNTYGKTEIRFLEQYCIHKALSIGRYLIENTNETKKKRSIDEARKHDVLDNFETLKVLLATLGYPLFEEKRKADNRKELFYCKGKQVSAQGELTDDGFLVYEGGACVLKESPKAPEWVIRLRKKLIDQEILKEKDDVLVFQKDEIFNSPSAAAVAVLGRTANGWMTWKNESGKTLDELKRK